ncbi:SusD/RagB family nutrient-binding outer membrane lipoprotein [Bacteroides sp. ET71]|uniref:RagB/SusD family nutrient uptake outer membrane protein n=1 Tax=Bacteroides sp. ET71 TaxID=2939421 RepID=UPI0020139B8C|nr:RagB/SusD family nutrient uptake outer membrane protein [Bacteroides sp. ET71]MCL1616379.1 SusD/RagB family nutrient-binding outer membrane lipoprotein [Bacteroides sp. ET71]
MKRYIVNTLMWGVLALGASGCTEKYLDINSNPYEPGDLNPDDYALGSAMNNLAGTVVSADVNTAQFTDCLLGGPCGGYFADSGAWAFSISNFNATNDWTRVFMMSDQIIPVLYSNLNQVQIVSQNTDNPVPYAIAMIIKVAAMSRVTDTYGPIPYTQIGVDGRVTVPYDSQETVYNAFFDELDEAIATLSENSSSALVPTADYVYSGNVQQWIKFANSLKLRLAMRISYANPAKAREMAESAVNQEFGVIESNEDNAAWHYFGSITNPLFTAINYNGDESRPSAEIVCYMNGYNDNRRASYFVNEDGAFDSDVYVGLRRSIDRTDEARAYFPSYSAINISANDAIQWMNAAEVAFLRAEGVAVFGFNLGGTAKDFYEQGIRLSFAQWGASGEDDYIEDDRSVPQTYTDPAGLNSYASTISDITIKWDESASTEEKQERIITQKWIANWMLGSEAWADYRRTGYPRLIPAPAAGNKSGGVVDSNRGARRMPYPSEENANNYENVQYARDHYLNGPDNMATDVWWACK